MSKQREAKYNRYPAWAPRFWHAMRFGAWIRLLARNRFRIHPLRLPTALAITVFSLVNSTLCGLQWLIYGRRIARTEIHPAPIFILGHWRSGTTFLHELMSRDPRLSFSSSLHCFAPNHFLLTGWGFTNLGGFLLPKQRPTDNMETGWLRPQEDEFGLVGMGAPSPYFRIAFPNHAAPDTCLIDMVDVPEQDLRSWKQCLRQFMKILTFNCPGRLVLKSPPHTGRLGVLREMFPDACFIHLVRNPYEVYPSTKRLWKSLDQVQALQKPRHEGLEEYVLSSLERMYESFESARQSLPENQIMDMRYEDLVQDPLGSLRSIYDYFDMDGFEDVVDHVAGYCEEQQGYQRNRYQLEDEERITIDRRWGKYFKPYGYDTMAEEVGESSEDMDV